MSSGVSRTSQEDVPKKTKSSSPLAALAVRARQVGAGKSAPQPEPLPVGSPHFREIEARQLAERDATGKRLRIRFDYEFR